jgi:transcriptional regulator with XRE-family HTH domain
VDQPLFADLAKFLAAFKEERGISQSDIARALKVAPSQPSGWFSGRSRPKPENLERMAEIYGLDLDGLLRLCKYRSGGKAGPSVDPEEAEFIALIRQVPAEARPTVKSMLRGLTKRRSHHVNRDLTEFDDELVDIIARKIPPPEPVAKPQRRYESQSVKSQIARYGFVPASV